MSSTSFAVREVPSESLAREDWRAVFRPAAFQPGGFQTAETDAEESGAPAPPRDAIELMLLHGDCAFLLDLWSL